MPVYQPGEIVLNIYQIEAFIGEGGYGEVYRARHIHLQRLDALKILRRAGMTETDYWKAEQRFKQEARLGDRVHPAIVRCTNYFPDEARGQLVLVMPFVSGGSLTQALKERRQQARPFGVSDTLRIGRQIAAGLAALHAQDVIHRDLSPNNILFDEDGNALIADLGSAQTPLGLTRRDQISEPGDAPLQPGTPGYRSPEHEDPLKPLRPPSDVYALGLLLFEMLTLRRFSDCAPGTRVSALRPDVPAALDELVARMLSEEPRQRPWDGAAAEKALQELSAAEPSEPAVGPIQPRATATSPATLPWTLDEGLTEIEKMEAAQEWQLALETLEQLEAAYPGHIRLKLPCKRITRALESQREAEEKAKREDEELAQREAEAKAKREAEERARREAEAKGKYEAEERARREAEEKAKREAALRPGYLRRDGDRTFIRLDSAQEMAFV
ncbi:MAG TPA: serine/threonine-protein kinase, partial [Anaerolineaceae bacterium]|nr:serine/threonine-protein kinase [Anaerolineaceae bacterium]